MNTRVGQVEMIMHIAHHHQVTLIVAVSINPEWCQPAGEQFVPQWKRTVGHHVNAVVYVKDAERYTCSVSCVDHL